MNEQSATIVKGTSRAAGTLELKVAREAVPAFLRQANQLAQSGHMEEACVLLNEENLAEIRRLGDQDPALADVLDLIVGNIFAKAERAQDAITWLKRTAARTPSVLVLNQLADALQGSGHFSEALTYRQQALALEPADPTARGGYAAALIKLGRVSEGIEQLEALIDSGADCYMAHSALLWFLHYLPDRDRQAVKAAHLSWGARYAPATLARRSHANDRGVDRRLRIGYVSADFRRHSVAYNFEPFLAGRQRAGAEVFGYANVARPDEMTRRL
ncbi:MAG: tetratricopeptide repeat protein, partial [Planctomycetes bacterium]|nr:tetratricopeptide repeat protein [Planctomycetota bacterium]